MAIIVPATLFAWGPDRPTFTEQNPAPYVTFDSITNNSFYGDERDFTTIKDASNTNDGGWVDNIAVQPGKEYVVRMYVHNNAASNLNLVATNVRASASVPTTTGKSVGISGFISSDNANPNKIWDDVQLTSDQNFNLAYVPGSASYHNNSVGKAPAGVALPDNIVTSTGALLGYDQLDGKIPGCYQYSGYVYFKVKPQFAPSNNFEATKQVRKLGDTTWQKSVAVNPGDTVQYELTYKDSGDTAQNNVVMQDTLPAGVNYVAGTSLLKNGTNPNGVKISDNVTTASGINVGNYNPGAAAYVLFNAKVGDNDSLPACGPNTLTNKVRVTADNGYKEDTADVTVNKTCQPVTPKYTCDALTVTKIDRTNFKFDTTYTVENATLKSITYIVRDANGNQISSSTSQNYTQATPGKYTVQAMVTVTVNGKDQTVTSDNCKKPFEVTEIPVTPVYTCDAITKSSLSRTQYSFTGTATAEGGATITGYTFDFGDGTTPQTGANATVQHTYQKDGTYTVKLSVNVKVNNENKTVTDATKCVTQVTVSPEECLPGIPVGDSRCTPAQECKPGIPMGDSRCEEKCTVPGKETLPKNSPDCVVTPPTTPPELPHTGASDNIFALLGAGSLIAAIGYYVASRRALQ